MSDVYPMRVLELSRMPLRHRVPMRGVRYLTRSGGREQGAGIVRGSPAPGLTLGLAVMPESLPHDAAERDPAHPDVLASLVANHRTFLAFLELRMGSRELAEDLLQDAFVKGIERIGELRDGESAVAWFYRVLRNALVDYYRRRDAEARAMTRAAAETDQAVEPLDAELFEAACACVWDLLGTIKPEYAMALRRVDLEGASLGDYAGEAGITPNNAGVRLHRARAALRKQVTRSCATCAEHGCLDCRCGKPAARR